MQVKEILNVLNLVKPGVATKDIVESLSYFYFTGHEVIAYNDLIAISHKLETPFKTFIKAKDFLSILSNLNSEEIEFAHSKEKSSLKIKSGTFKSTIPTITDKVFVKKIKKINESIEGAKFIDINNEILEAIDLCQHTTSSNEAEGTLTCVKVSKDAVMSTDSKRLSYVKLKKNSPFEFFIKATTIPELIKIKATKMAIGSAWYHFKNEEGCVFSIREIKGTFPDITEILNVEGTQIELPEDLTKGLDLVSIFADELSPTVVLSIEKGKCTLEITTEKGKASYFSKNIKYKGEPLSIKINPGFLYAMLKHTTSLTLGTKLVSIEMDNFRMLTALIG